MGGPKKGKDGKERKAVDTTEQSEIDVKESQAGVVASGVRHIMVLSSLLD